MEGIPSFWTAYKTHYMNFCVHSRRSKTQIPWKLKQSTAHHLEQEGGSPKHRHEQDEQSRMLFPKSRWETQQSSPGKTSREHEVGMWHRENTQPAWPTAVLRQAPKLQRSPVTEKQKQKTNNKNQRTHRSVTKPGSLITRQILWEEALADDNRGVREYLYVLQHYPPKENKKPRCDNLLIIII